MLKFGRAIKLIRAWDKARDLASAHQFQDAFAWISLAEQLMQEFTPKKRPVMAEIQITKAMILANLERYDETLLILQQAMERLPEGSGNIEVRHLRFYAARLGAVIIEAKGSSLPSTVTSTFDITEPDYDLDAVPRRTKDYFSLECGTGSTRDGIS